MAVVASAAFAGGGLLVLVSYGIRWLDTDPLVWRAGFWDEFLNFALTIIQWHGLNPPHLQGPPHQPASRPAGRFGIGAATSAGSTALR